MNDEIKRADRDGYGGRQCVILRASLCGLALWGAAACSASDHPTTDPPTTPGADADLADAANTADQDSGESHPAEEETCGAVYLRDPSDDRMSNNLVEWTADSGEIDLFLPGEISDWMTKRLWQKGHNGWHIVRQCRRGGFGDGSSDGGIPPIFGDGGFPPGFDGGFPTGPGGIGGPSRTALCARTELLAEHAECADAEDGYQFLVAHRHMIEGLKQAFPRNVSMFDAFPHFPFDAADVPPQWRDRFGTGWAAQILDDARLMEDIENHLSEFPTEGDLGKFIQCGPMANGAAGLHGALHGKWSVASSPHLLGDQSANLENYMFWKLHGWIDLVWERYRVARGLTPDEPKLKQAMTQQCLEMHTLGHTIEEIEMGAADAGPLPEEHGFFHETIRPLFDKTCSGCHTANSPQGQIVLGGHISSADVVANLVNVQATGGGQFRRVVPGNPDESWLYLKVSGRAAAAGCKGTACNAEVMPPTGEVTLTDAQLGAIRRWILDGAPGPTSSSP
jgi:hypothetical protein